MSRQEPVCLGDSATMPSDIRIYKPILFGSHAYHFQQSVLVTLVVCKWKNITVEDNSDN